MIALKKIDNHFSTYNHFKFFSPIFRAFICLHLLKDLYYSWDLFPLLYLGKSFYPAQTSVFLDFFNISANVIREHFHIFIFLYIALIILWFFGIGKYLTSLLLFLFLCILQRMCHIILNGGDNLLFFCVLYMIFIDSYSFLSIKKSSPYKNNKITHFINFISNLSGYSICIHLCLVYFVSAMHKIHSDVWFNGIATYYIMKLERFQAFKVNNVLAKNGYFVTLTTYGSMFVELFYPFLIWLARWRYLMITLAVLLHLYIYFFMMLYDFQILYIIVQGFFIPNKSWEKFITKYFKLQFND